MCIGGRRGEYTNIYEFDSFSMKELIESGRLFLGKDVRDKFRARMVALSPDKVLMIFLAVAVCSGIEN